MIRPPSVARRPLRPSSRLGLAAVALAAGLATATLSLGQSAPAAAKASSAAAGPATAPASAPTTQPATKPAGVRGMSADEMLGQALRPPAVGPAQPLQPMPEPPAGDRTSGPGAVKPNAPTVPTLREGTLIIDRQGRLSKSADGATAEFIFESDGKAMRDPPMIVVPCLKLMMMENANAGSNRDLRFRVTGTVTEYRLRNYILLEKVTVVPDVTQQF